MTKRVTKGIQTFTGPWKGLEWRASHQTPQHDEVAINIDYSRGHRGPRAAVSRLGSTNPPGVGWLHAPYSPRTSEQYLLAIGLNKAAATGPTDMKYTINDLGGAELAATAIGNNPEPFDLRFKCSFVDILLPNDGAEARHATLITTAWNAYVYDPLEDETVIRLANMAKIGAAGDTVRLNDVNISYWESRPTGYIATEHQGRVYTAGYRDNFAVTLSNVLEEGQALVPESVINQSKRSEYKLGPQWVSYSDEFDPLGIQAHHIFAVEEQERVTGLKSFQEQLVVFTEHSIFVLTGGTDATFRLYKAVSGVGCAAHASIQEVGGVLYFLSHDGMYAWAGGSKAQKLTDGIDELWTGKYTRTHFPPVLDDTLNDIGYPWTIAAGDLPMAQSVHYQRANQIMWSLPIQGRRYLSFPVTLVYQYDTKALSLWTCDPSSGPAASVMVGAVAIKTGGQGGRERLFTIGHNTSNDGILQEYDAGGAIDAGANEEIPVVWESGRLFSANDKRLTVRSFRMKMLSASKSVDGDAFTNGPQWFVDTEEAHTNRSNTELVQSGDLDMHPNQATGSFWDTAKWDTAGDVWEERDWFTTDSESSTITQTARVGFLDRDSESRQPTVVMDSFSVEITAGDPS